MNDFEIVFKNALPYNSSETNPLMIDLQRKHFFNFCKENGLDKKFSKLLANDPYWREIAKFNQVYFLEEIVYKKGKNKLPTIKLTFFNNWSSPVIKLILSKDSDFFTSR